VKDNKKNVSPTDENVKLLCGIKCSAWFSIETAILTEHTTGSVPSDHRCDSLSKDTQVNKPDVFALLHKGLHFY